MISKEDLEIYLKIKSYGKPLSIRGFQRLMNYSSPGKAQRVLSRLERLGFIERTASNEFIARKSLPPQLAVYVVVRGYVVPRVLVYAVYATTTIAVYAVLSIPPINIIVLLLAIVVPYWVETIRAIDILRTLIKSG